MTFGENDRTGISLQSFDHSIEHGYHSSILSGMKPVFLQVNYISLEAKVQPFFPHRGTIRQPSHCVESSSIPWKRFFVDSDEKQFKKCKIPLAFCAISLYTEIKL